MKTFLRLATLSCTLAAAFAVLNAMWFELMEDEAMRHDKLDAPS